MNCTPLNRILQLLFALVAISASTSSSAESLNIVATIKPIQSLMINLTLGVVEPNLLIRGTQSPHTFNLRPSDVRKLKQAQLIIWMGESIETTLDGKLPKIAKTSTIISLTDQQETNPTAHSDKEPSDDHHGQDLHLWLSPVWAKSKIPLLLAHLIRLDPNHKSQYEKNAFDLQRRLTALDTTTRRLLEPVKEIPYLVFHDAFSHFEALYGLNNRGAIRLSPERQPGARHITQLRNMIEQNAIRCLFTEPQVDPKLAHKLIRATSTKLGSLDPLGSSLPEGPDSYFLLITHLTESYLNCLR